MGVVIDFENMRWAEEPAGDDTRHRYIPVEPSKRRRLNDTATARLWALKDKRA